MRTKSFRENSRLRLKSERQGGGSGTLVKSLGGHAQGSLIKKKKTLPAEGAFKGKTLCRWLGISRRESARQTMKSRNVVTACTECKVRRKKKKKKIPWMEAQKRKERDNVGAGKKAGALAIERRRKGDKPVFRREKGPARRAQEIEKEIIRTKERSAGGPIEVRGVMKKRPDAGA